MLGNLINKWKNKVSEYIDTQLQLLQLEVVERVATILSFVVYLILFSFLLFIAFVLFGIGLSEFLSALFESKLMGYSLVAFLYLIGLFVIVRQHVLADMAAIKAEHVRFQRHRFAFFRRQHDLRVDHGRATVVAHEAEVGRALALDVIGRVIVVAAGVCGQRCRDAGGQCNCTKQHGDHLNPGYGRWMLAESATTLKPRSHSHRQ